MRDYAREIGADENEFLEALKDITVMPLEQFKSVSRALFLIANQMSARVFHNLQLTHLLDELERMQQIINRSPVTVFRWRNEQNWPVEFASGNVEQLTGYTAAAFMSGNVLYSDCVHTDDLARMSDEVARNAADLRVTGYKYEPHRIKMRSGLTK